jgi:glycosyltransferase involved in cell wall biosynthesis
MLSACPRPLSRTRALYSKRVPPASGSSSRLIAHVLPYPSVGGTEHATLRVIKAVEPAGFEALAVLLSDTAELRRFFGQENVPVMGWSAAEPSLRRGRTFLTSARALAREFQRLGVRLVHCSDYLAGWYVGLAGRLAGVPVLCHIRNRHQLSWRERLSMRAITHFAFVSRDTWDHFPYRVPARHGTVVYDGMRPPPPMPAAARERERARLKAELGLPDSVRLIGMLARVTPQKDYDTLVKAAGQVVRAHPEARFIVAGDTSSTEASRMHCAYVRGLLETTGLAGFFVLTGYRSDVARLLDCFDISVLSTHWEGLPLALLEAMGHGQAVVATAVDGIPELIKNGANGFLTPHEDGAALAGRLLELLDSPAECARLGQAAQQTVRDGFTPESFAAALTGLYRRLLR